MSHKREQKGRGGEDAAHKPSRDEYLSGFYKTDKLVPVVTLAVFFSPEEWDGPLTLKEMYAAADESVMQYVPDYKVNLVAPERMSEEEMDEFRSSLREVMLYIKYSKDKEKLREVTQKNRNFRRLERQAAEVINITTNSNLKYPEEQEAVDVCAAIQELVADSKTEGKIQGAVETYQEVGVSLHDAVRRIAEKYNFSQQQSAEEVKKYWK